MDKNNKIGAIVKKELTQADIRSKLKPGQHWNRLETIRKDTLVRQIGEGLDEFDHLTEQEEVEDEHED